MAEKTNVLITGGNTGLGYEVVKALVGNSSQSYHIIVGSRSVDKAEEAISKLQSEFPQSTSTLEALQVDIVSDESIQQAHDKVSSKIDRLDVLINNAGAQFDSQMDITKSSSIRNTWNKTYDVNVSGTQVITTMFIPLLLKSSNPRLIFITSGLSTLTGTSTKFGGTGPGANTSRSPPAGWPKPPGPATASYRSSKAALNMMMLDWQRVLENDGVKVWSISPGLLATGLASGNAEDMKKMGALDPAIGGRFVRDVVEGKRDADKGKVVNNGGLQPW